MGRGYFGIGIVNGKTEKNIGTLWRTATLYGADFIFTVGARYERHQASDTPKTPLHTPLFQFADIDDLIDHMPRHCPLVAVELDPRARPLREFTHLDRSCYLLGAEDHGLSPDVLDRCHYLVQIPTPHPASMNVATAGALVMDHRYNSRIGALV